MKAERGDGLWRAQEALRSPPWCVASEVNQEGASWHARSAIELRRIVCLAEINPTRSDLECKVPVLPGKPLEDILTGRILCPWVFDRTITNLPQDEPIGPYALELSCPFFPLYSSRASLIHVENSESTSCPRQVDAGLEFPALSDRPFMSRYANLCQSNEKISFFFASCASVAALRGSPEPRTHLHGAFIDFLV